MPVVVMLRSLAPRLKFNEVLAERFLRTERSISATRTWGITCWLPVTVSMLTTLTASETKRCEIFTAFADAEAEWTLPARKTLSP